MGHHANHDRIERLNDPGRLKMIPPEYIWNILRPERHSEKVEIGAGAGIFCRAFQKLSAEGTMTAIDISERTVEWMKKNVVPDYPEIVPVLSDGKLLPLEAESTDLVFMITVYHELEDQQVTLNESYRILRPGGKICIIDWNMNNLDFGPPAVIRCNTEGVSLQLEKAGFMEINSDDGLDDFFILTALK